MIEEHGHRNLLVPVEDSEVRKAIALLGWDIGPSALQMLSECVRCGTRGWRHCAHAY